MVAQGDFAGARKLHEDVLAVRRRVMEPEHPDTLTSMDHLGHTLGAQGDSVGVRKASGRGAGGEPAERRWCQGHKPRRQRNLHDRARIPIRRVRCPYESLVLTIL